MFKSIGGRGTAKLTTIIFLQTISNKPSIDILFCYLVEREFNEMVWFMPYCHLYISAVFENINVNHVTNFVQWPWVSLVQGKTNYHILSRFLKKKLTINFEFFTEKSGLTKLWNWSLCKSSYGMDWVSTAGPMQRKNTGRY